MKYTLIIEADCHSKNSQHALTIANALLESGHTIYRLFFVGDGVSHGAETQGNAKWTHFIVSHQLDAVLCSNSAKTFNLIGDNNTSLALSAFNVAGLAQLIDASTAADRMLTFGG